MENAYSKTYFSTNWCRDVDMISLFQRKGQIYILYVSYIKIPVLLQMLYALDIEQCFGCNCISLCHSTFQIHCYFANDHHT